MSWEPGKPSQNENEYFARQDEEWKRARRAELNVERAAKDEAARHLHCPRCEGHLVEREFHHVRVDVCQDCRGVWLDHGELELLAHVGKTELQKVIRAIDTLSS